MQNKQTLKNYEQYLDLITKEINKMFENQKEYICCSNGCSLCCEQGMYPFSEIEFEYIKQAYEKLPNDIKQKVKDNVQELSNFIGNGDFLYKCPFLIDKSCSVYSNRGLICRTFGLISENAAKKLTIPYCAENGLNYSKVYDKETHQIYMEKVQELGYKNIPMAYNLSKYNLMYGIAKSLNFDWGESKLLIEWLVEYFSNLTDSNSQEL